MTQVCDKHFTKLDDDESCLIIHFAPTCPICELDRILKMIYKELLSTSAQADRLAARLGKANKEGKDV